MKRRSGVFGAGVDMIEAFKAQWPCHGLPDELTCIVAHVDARGDLVDLECFDEDGHPLDSHEFDGAALVALVADSGLRIHGAAGWRRNGRGDQTQEGLVMVATWLLVAAIAAICYWIDQGLGSAVVALPW